MKTSNTDILITDGVDLLLVEGLKKYGRVTYMPDITYQEVLNTISNYSGIVVNSKIRVDRNFLHRATSLNWIGRLGSGLDIIDLEAAEEFGVHVLNSPEGNANAVGEHALAMLLNLLNKIRLGDAMVRSLDSWQRELVRGVELDGRTVGIIGCGHTGSAFVRKLRGFDCRVLVYDKYRKNIPKIHDQLEEVEVEMLLKESDIVSLHLPLTAETRNLVDCEFLSKMKPQSILINTSRGQVLCLKDLVDALDSGHLVGACIDVFPNEKPDQWSMEERELMRELTQNSSVVLTPHVAGWTSESKKKIAQILLKRIIYVLENEDGI